MLLTQMSTLSLLLINAFMLNAKFVDVPDKKVNGSEITSTTFLSVNIKLIADIFDYL